MLQPIINKMALFYFCLPSIFVAVTWACTTTYARQLQTSHQAICSCIHFVLPPGSLLCSMRFRSCTVVRIFTLLLSNASWQHLFQHCLPLFSHCPFFSVVVFPMSGGCDVSPSLLTLVVFPCPFWSNDLPTSSSILSPKGRLMVVVIAS